MMIQSRLSCRAALVSLTIFFCLFCIPQQVCSFDLSSLKQSLSLQKLQKVQKIMISSSILASCMIAPIVSFADGLPVEQQKTRLEYMPALQGLDYGKVSITSTDIDDKFIYSMKITAFYSQEHHILTLYRPHQACSTKSSKKDKGKAPPQHHLISYP